MSPAGHRQIGRERQWLSNKCATGPIALQSFKGRIYSKYKRMKNCSSTRSPAGLLSADILAEKRNDRPKVVCMVQRCIPSNCIAIHPWHVLPGPGGVFCCCTFCICVQVQLQGNPARAYLIPQGANLYFHVFAFLFGFNCNIIQPEQTLSPGGRAGKIQYSKTHWWQWWLCWYWCWCWWCPGGRAAKDQ